MRRVLVLLVLACSASKTPVVAGSGSAPPVADAARSIDDDRHGPATVAAIADAAVPDAAIPDAPPAKPGYDFIAEVRALYRNVACGDLDKPVDPKLAKIVDAHCKALLPFMEKYRAEYFGKARAWFVAHEPKDLPPTAVYAFGGGDLVSALVAFPDATEITTLSLELAGDPRKFAALPPSQVASDLAAFRKDIGMLIWVGSNLSTNLSDQQRSGLAAQLSSHLLGLSTGGYEPIAARFFAIADDGSLHYFEKDEIDADLESGKSLSGSWKTPAFSQSFGNVEIEYRKIGETTTRIHRHIGWNLGDADLKDHPGVLRHLESKGKVAVLVKGASYLLWMDDFAMFRNYLIDHLFWMIADSTGLAPNFLVKTNLVQEAYGAFTGPVLPKMAGMRGDIASQKLWAKPKDRMPFRFGYLDKDNHSHVVITHPK